MEKSFHCPACGAPLINPEQAELVICSFCHTTVLPSERLGKAHPIKNDKKVKPVKAKTLHAISWLAQSNRETEAINVILQNFKISRDKAEKAVRLLAAGKPAHLGKVVIQPDRLT